MKKVSWRRISLLGLTLVAASAVTAAFVKSDIKPVTANGSLTFLTGAGQQTFEGQFGTCTASAANGCDASTAAGSGTTGAGTKGTNTRPGNGNTANNTTTTTTP